jgi:hypothetical protein
VSFPTYFDGRFVHLDGPHPARVREISHTEDRILVACADCKYMAVWLEKPGRKKNPLRVLIPGGSSHA